MMRGRMPKIVLVTGGRDFKDYDLVSKALTEVQPTLLINGKAKGADELSTRWCEEFGVDVLEMRALWKARGKGAGPIRNRRMLKAFLLLAGENEKVVVAFPGGSGTNDMKEIARNAGVEVVEFK